MFSMINAWGRALGLGFSFSRGGKHIAHLVLNNKNGVDDKLGRTVLSQKGHETEQVGARYDD